TRGENTVTIFQDQNGVKRLRREMTSKMGAYDDLINRQAQQIEQLKIKLAEYEQSKGQLLGKELLAALQNDQDFAKQFATTLATQLKNINQE
ncbi:MAG: hypothetical protein ACP5FL_08015, partial [Thermoplasmatota archaeon]